MDGVPACAVGVWCGLLSALEEKTVRSCVGGSDERARGDGESKFCTSVRP